MQLAPHTPWIFGIHRVLLRIVSIARPASRQDRVKQRSVSEGVANAAESDDVGIKAITGEVVLS